VAGFRRSDWGAVQKPPSLTIRVAAIFLGALAIARAAGGANGAAGPATELDWWPMALGMAGGLALFLFGMEQMTAGLKAAAGSRMKDFLARFTTNRVSAAATGAAVTAVIQSSSITTVLLVGFVSAGLMSLTQSIGVIMGSNVGTTLTAQLVAFQVDKLALLLLATGFATMSFARRDRAKQVGGIVLGLGLVFFGMGMMSEAMHPLRSYQPFIEWMGQMENPLLGILAGLAFTALVQSSSATTGVVIALASQGLISLTVGIALIFGSNIGTCVTALLASLGKSREARRVAIAHVLFNVLGVALWLAFIPQLADLVTSLSPQSPELTGRQRLAADLPRQVANAHTVFNLVNTLVMLPFAGLLGRLVVRLTPDRPAKTEPLTRFLDDKVIEVPSLALQQVRLETGELGALVRGMFDHAADAFDGKPDALLEVSRQEQRSDALQREIIRYLGRLRKEDLTDADSAEFQALMASINDLESIGDVICDDIAPIADRVRVLGPSDTMREMLDGLAKSVVLAFDETLQALHDQDPEVASTVIARKQEMARLYDQVFEHQQRRFLESTEDRVDIYRLETDLADKLRRIYSLAKRIAHRVNHLSENPN